MRHYYCKYQHILKNGSTLNIVLRAFRDRDGLVDLDKNSHMGERKTDSSTFALGLNDYSVGTHTTLSPLMYYQTAVSRFRRYGYRKSLDDDALGFHLNIETHRDKMSYSLLAYHDITLFDSRIHDKSWSQNDSEISILLYGNDDKKHLRLQGGYLRSSKYGSGIKFEGEVGLSISQSHELIVHGLVADEFPDTGNEYYPSLVFSDTVLVSDLKKYRQSIFETGIRLRKKHYQMGLFGFGSYSESILFMPSSSVFDVFPGDSPASSRCLMISKEPMMGLRVSFDSQIEKHYIINIKFSLTGIPDAKKVWPYPSIDCFSGVTVSKNYINEHLKTTLWGNARFLRWYDRDSLGRYSSPWGNYILFNCGLNIHVSTLELFYAIENITDANITWFDTMNWLGRTSFWGGKWVFFN
jgi:hypothetical protein